MMKTTNGAPPIIATTGRRGGIGQMSMRREGGVAETGEALAWSALLIIARLVLVLSILFWLWALGKYGCAGALFVAIIVYSLGWLEQPTGTIAMGCGALLLTAFVFIERVIVWPELAGFQPLDLFTATQWPWYLLVLVLPPIFWSVYPLINWRCSNELSDPNFPGFIGQRDPFFGPARPGQQLSTTPKDEVEQPEIVERVVVRPVPVNAVAMRNIDPAEAPPLPPDVTGIQSPDGKEFAVAEFVRWVKRAYTLGIKYSALRGEMSYADWGHFVDTLAELGICSARAEGKETTLLCDNVHTAVGIVKTVVAGGT